METQEDEIPETDTRKATGLQWDELTGPLGRTDESVTRAAVDEDRTPARTDRSATHPQARESGPDR
jgi:hypothetical protein